MQYTAVAKHKTLNRDFKVLELNLQNQTVRCEGEVEKGICLYCPVTEKCPEPYFKISEVELEIKLDGRVLK